RSSVKHRFTCGAGVETTTRRGVILTSPPLIGWRANDQPVEGFGDLDLTGKSGSRLHLKCRIELLFFFGRRWTDDLEPFLVNVNKAGRAGTAAAAFGDDAGNVVAQRGFHHCRTELSFHCVLRPVVFDVGNLGHWIRTHSVHRRASGSRAKTALRAFRPAMTTDM